MKFTAVVTAHDNNPNPIIDCLSAQTTPPEEILVGLSGDCEDVVSNSGAIVKHFPSIDDYGYSKRNALAEDATGDVLGFFCCDDSYRRDYLSLMAGVMAAFESDVVWCRWTSATNRAVRDMKHGFWPCNSTLGNFIIKRGVFSRVGGFQKFQNMGDNPGYFDAGLISALNKDKSVVITEIPEVLYFHNYPFDIRVSPTAWGRKVSGN